MTRKWMMALLVCGSAVPARAQTYNIVLGRPTHQSVTVSALFSVPVSARFEYGLTPAALIESTPLYTSLPETPVVAELAALQPNKRYYYRAVYKKPNDAAFQFSPVYTFHTQRAQGAGFTFLIEADEHLYDKKGVRSLYEVCLQNQVRDSADFMFSLGDTFGDDHTPYETTDEDMKALHLEYRQYLGALCHSTPFFFCLGNHEGESGWWLQQSPPENIAVYGTLWRKFYYPNPFPNDFYSGNTIEEPYGMGYPENYYAFTWGDALFVVLDVYRDCDVDEKPKQWDWTLGETQYNWLKNTLETSTATHKFVFAHHNRGQGRGGILPARGYEWGGYGNNGNGSWEFDEMRPGWAMPVHQLMANNGVEIFFQGHDHLYAREELDGVVYQEVPMPSDSTYQIGVTDNGDAYTGVILDGAGHLRVRVEQACVTVDYIAAWLPQDTTDGRQNRQVRYSYQVGACSVSAQEADGAASSFCTIAPNPAKDQLVITPYEPAARDYTVALYDLRGALLRTETLKSGSTALEINLSGVGSGIYLLKVSGDNISVLKKVAVCK